MSLINAVIFPFYYNDPRCFPQVCILVFYCSYYTIVFILWILCLISSAVKDASGRSDVRNAKDAIDAYKNITDAINAAEAAANEAKQAADDALNVRD